MVCINLALLAVLGGIVVKTVWAPRALTPTAATAEPRTPVARQAEAPETRLNANQYQEIVRRNLFGLASTEPAAPTAAAPAPVVTAGDREVLSLPLVLQGTITGAPEFARAILYDTQARKTDLFRLGDQVRSARITAIRRDEVVLLHQGREFVIAIDRNSTAAVPAGGAAGAAGSGGSAAAAAVSKPPAGDRTAAGGRAEILEDFLTQVEISPHQQNNEVVGLEIRHLENVPAIQWLGLQEGDVIHRVNGQVLTSKQKAFQVFRKVRTQPQVLIELLRNDRLETLAIPLR
ncbi:MAG: hypothetical protein JW810_04525 [Sedimentisphaerales bacterium]|nr:hypothetical protein [Sedimentisphaerales bacterium]